MLKILFVPAYLLLILLSSKVSDAKNSYCGAFSKSDCVVSARSNYNFYAKAGVGAAGMFNVGFDNYYNDRFWENKLLGNFAYGIGIETTLNSGIYLAAEIGGQSWLRRSNEDDIGTQISNNSVNSGYVKGMVGMRVSEKGRHYTAYGLTQVNLGTMYASNHIENIVISSDIAKFNNNILTWAVSAGGGTSVSIGKFVDIGAELAVGVVGTSGSFGRMTPVDAGPSVEAFAQYHLLSAVNHISDYLLTNDAARDALSLQIIGLDPSHPYPQGLSWLLVRAMVEVILPDVPNEDINQGVLDMIDQLYPPLITFIDWQVMDFFQPFGITIGQTLLNESHDAAFLQLLALLDSVVHQTDTLLQELEMILTVNPDALLSDSGLMSVTLLPDTAVLTDNKDTLMLNVTGQLYLKLKF